MEAKEKTLTVTLDREDVENMLAGCSPDLHIMNELPGTYYGGMNDHWEWDRHRMKSMSVQELYDCYRKCKRTNRD